MGDAREQEIKTITFGRKELDPEEEQAYLKRVEDARRSGVNALKGSTPVGGIKRPPMPDLQRALSQDGLAAIPGMTPEGGVKPRPHGSPVISSQTAQGLEKALQAQHVAEQKQEDAVAPEQSEEEKKAEKEENLLDLFDFAGQNEAERILNNKKRREEIEKRCESMSFEDLLFKGEVQQTVPIIPGKFEPRFRSLLPEESLFIKRFLARDEEKAPTDAYYMERFSLCQLTCALVSINGNDLPPHLDSHGEPEIGLFRTKLKRLQKMSGYVVADLATNFIWFDIRVRKLLNPEALGNF